MAALAGMFGAFVTQNRKAGRRLGGPGARIREILEEMEPVLEQACAAVCPGCTDVCCARATIWYDFKDLLYLFFTGSDTGRLPGPGFPDGQIRKVKEPGGGQTCVHLGPDGCSQPRIRRPFVCTWYLCPDQKQWLRTQPGSMETLESGLARIKALRQEMAGLYRQKHGREREFMV